MGNAGGSAGAAADAMQRGEAHRKAKQYQQAIAAYMDAIKAVEKPDADVCLKLARCHEKLGDHEATIQWLLRVVDSAEAFLPWQSAAAMLEQMLKSHGPPGGKIKRAAKVALLGSYTTTQFVPMLRLAAMREGILLEVQEGHYGQYQQEVIDPRSRLYAFDPDFVIFAVHAGEVGLPSFSTKPQVDVEAEVSRWKSLWDALASHSKARVIMHNFAVPVEAPMGHLGSRLTGSRASMLQQVNFALGQAAGSSVSIVDCDRVASLFGKRRWFDDKYWHLSKQAVALDALPLLARHTVAVLAADLGLSKKCLVMDLDNTLWGGVIGEDGLAGIKLGQGSPEGEAFIALQQYAVQLKNKGVILAVCSKNNEADAKEPFEKHPDMVLKLEDLAMFVANWERKSDNIKTIAKTLNIGLDSLVFIDDNPVEREVIRQFLPEVEVLPLPRDPAGYARALADYLMFETSSFTKEDAEKTEQYRAKAQISQLEAAAGSIEDFYRSLQMQAVVQPFDELHLPRIVQLLGKTNQFNLTTRRHTMQAVRQFMADPNCAHFYLKLRDRFTDHGLVSMIIARKDGDVMDIDTWLMSCRVIGRTVEAELLSQVSAAAQRLGCTTIRGTFIPTAKNEMVKEVFGQYGFAKVSTAADCTTVWQYDLAAQGPIVNGFIELIAETGTDGSNASDAA
jgi:FkbH-like protein